MSSWVVIGLCGVTNSGKTSLSRAIANRYPGTLELCQDTYFLPVDSPNHVYAEGVNHFNWELMSALDMDKMVADVHKIIDREPLETESGILVLDGFLLLSHKQISSLCSIKVYLDLDYEEVRKRRLTRSYDPPDPPGYFDKVVWPESRKAKEHMFIRNKDILLLSGKNTIEQNLDKICEKLEHFNFKRIAPSKAS
uniref:Unkown protein n=1 Tax=Riptortus pedestris TaxID=329032 RepID=R4WD82_RIPPE|nr:unkown protein [Riptortus pedestris]